MIQLTGENLGKRQQELNEKVLGTVQKQISFNEVQGFEEKSDIDKLYKIDVALHYKNIDYIVEILKCGDALFISRVLKSDWLYDKEYSHIVNPDYLHHEIFPLMSFKMKTKMLNAIAANIRDEERAATFFEYCKELKMISFALKFIVHTSETYKCTIIENNIDLLHSVNLKNFFGDSFVLTRLYITKINSYQKRTCLNKLSHLYTIDEDQYLDLFEANIEQNLSCSFGGRMSKSIMTKHKSRVLAKPLLYIKSLNKYAVARHCTSEDAKNIISVHFPAKVDKFWRHNFYETYKYLFNKIPSKEIFSFFKSTFLSLYGNDQLFEMTYKFYEFHYDELFTLEEREQWALKHIEEGKELLGVNNDFLWYAFVNFDSALKPIKNYIFLTKDEDLRNRMVRTLVTSCRNQKHLETLFSYFYERHVNESCHHKEDFVDKVLDKHNVFEFEDSCWTALDKILYSMEVYTPGFYGRDRYRALCIIYNILHGKDMADALTYHLDTHSEFSDIESFHDRLNNDQWLQVYQYLYDYYNGKFQSVSETDINETKKEKVTTVESVINLLKCFKKPMEILPPIMVSFIDENPDDFKYLKRNEKRFTEADLLRLLKKDKTLVLEALPKMQKAMDSYGFRLTRFVKKIQIYFNDDLRLEYIRFFNECVSNINSYPWYSIRTSVYSLFQLENENSKLKFLNKYVPVDEKIDHRNIDRKLLAVQEIICRFAGYARPPLPLQNVLQYIKGDYVHFCLPMFNMLVANLPLPLSNRFIEAILNNPLSIQKHGIRLAFKVYSNENLNNLISKIWDTTKNVSLRLIIYKALVNKINEATDTSRKELIEILKYFTSTLNGDDDDEIFDLLCRSKIPSLFEGDVLKVAWLAIKNITHKKTRNIILKIKVVNAISVCSTIDRDFLRSQIITEHIEKMLCKKEILEDFKPEEKSLHKSLWIITSAYIISCDKDEFKSSLEILELILQETFNNWNTVVNEKYVFIKFFYNFIYQVRTGSISSDYSFPFVVPMFEKILKKVEDFSPSHEMFLLTLEIKLFIAVIIIGNKTEKELKLVAEDASKSLLTYVQELRANNFIIPCFFNNISGFISRSLQALAITKDLNADMLIVYTCTEILKSNDIDAIIFAISIMPVECPESYEDQFRAASSTFTEKVKQINNFQVQSYFYKKFYLSGVLKVY